MTGTSADSHRVECQTEDLVRAIELLWAVRSRGTSVTIGFANGELVFGRGATTVRAPATGTWPNVAQVPAQFVRALLKRRRALPERVVIVGGETEVHVSHYSVRCRWRAR